MRVERYGGKAWAGPPGFETAMPKFQTVAARVAREIQGAIGLKYTRALRLFAPSQTSLALADELRAAGLSKAAEDLVDVELVCAVSGMWADAYAVIEEECWITDPEKVVRARSLCREAGNAVMRRVGFPDSGFMPGAEIYHAAFLALSRAGSVLDGRSLARAALDVFDGDPLMCSDIIRTSGRQPFTYESAAELDGPATPGAAPARMAARAMAAASRIGSSCDEQWYRAAEFMVSAAWYGGVAAGCPPLHDLPAFQDFLEVVMIGSVDAFVDSPGS